MFWSRQEILRAAPLHLSPVGLEGLLAIVESAGEEGRWRFLEFFTANVLFGGGACCIASASTAMQKRHR